MSPELIFLLSLVLRMAVAAAFVVIASMITERSGPAIGALIATLPISGGPSYVFLAIDHDDVFIAQSALASVPMNAASVMMSVVFIFLVQRLGVLASVAGGLAAWFTVAFLVTAFAWSLAGGILLNAITFAICLPLVQRFRVAKMPIVASRWYDIPLRAALVATLVAVVVTLSGIVGPRVSGVIALFPAVFTSLILILTPRIGGAATAAVLANGQWGLIGFGLGVLTIHLATPPFGRAAALSLALAVCIAWNLGLWAYGHRKKA
ncbi:MAG: hypothetical protein WDO17_28755 [Alphaproteobacteria bacterium]